MTKRWKSSGWVEDVEVEEALEDEREGRMVDGVVDAEVIVLEEVRLIGLQQWHERAFAEGDGQMNR